MHHHPETLLALHKERHARLEADAALYALVKPLRRHRRRWQWRRARPLKPVRVRLRPLPR